MIFSIFQKIPFLKRLIPSIIKRYSIYFNDYERELRFEDIVFNLDIRHLIDRSFYINRNYEEASFDTLKQSISRDGMKYFFDVGACWGIYSLRFAKKFPDLNIIAIDPIINNVARLKKSIEKNNLNNIAVVHSAIGDTQGTVTLGSESEASPNYSINHQNSAVSEISPINTLDDLYNFREKSIAMKIDVEGFEYEVINGALSFLKNNKIFLQIEVRYENYEKIKNYLYVIGYHIIEGKPPKIAGSYTDCFFKNY